MSGQCLINIFFQMDSVFRTTTEDLWARKYEISGLCPHAAYPFPVGPLLRSFLPSWTLDFFTDMWRQASLAGWKMVKRIDGDDFFFLFSNLG